MSENNEAVELAVFERAHVIRNVIEGAHLVGFNAKNRFNNSSKPYRYTADALKAAVKLYENVDVYISHGDETMAERKVADKIGYIESPTFKEGVGIVGNIVLNEKHPFYEATRWWAEKKPSKLGMSHVANTVFDIKENAVVEIRKVHSVDFVNKPSTTDALFKEGVISDKVDERKLEHYLDGMWSLIYEAQYPMAGNKLPQPDRALKILPVVEDMVKELKKLAKTKTTTESEQSQKEDTDMDLTKLTLEELKQHRSDIVSAIAVESVANHLAVEAKIVESLKDIPEKLQTKHFVTLVREAVTSKDDAKLATLLDDRKQLIPATKVETTSVESVAPKSDQQKQTVPTAIDGKELVALAKRKA